MHDCDTTKVLRTHFASFLFKLNKQSSHLKYLTLCVKPITRMSSFYRSFLESNTNINPLTLEDSVNSIDSPNDLGIDDDEVLEQYRRLAVHEAHLRLKNATGVDLDHREKVSNQVKQVKTNKMLLKVQLPQPKPITTTSNNMPELREPSLSSFRCAPVFCGRRTQIEPEVTPGELVLRDDDVPVDHQVIQCLGCREKLCCKRRAMMVRCPNCSIESPAISGRVNENDTYV